MKNYYKQVTKNDFERYKIPISLGNFLPKTKQKYIWAELEKRHPCFSDNFCFFSKSKLSKKGIISDVFVIEKSKLGKYKNSKGEIIVDGKKICTKINNKRFFILVISCIGLVSLGYLLINEKIKNLNNKAVLIDNNPNCELIEENVDFGFYDKKILEQIIKETKNHNGNIRNFQWKITKTGEIINGTIEKLYPEQIERNISGIDIRSINYIKNVPVLDFYVSNRFNSKSNDLNENCISLESREIIRKFINKEQLILLEESLNPYKISIYFPIEKEQIINTKKERLLYKINQYLLKNNLYIKGLNIKDTGKFIGGVTVCLELYLTESDFYKNNILNFINDDLDIFYKEKNVEPIRQRKEIDRILVNEDHNILIGEVKHSSGNRILFYKTLEGKIIKKEVFANDKI